MKRPDGPVASSGYAKLVRALLANEESMAHYLQSFDQLTKAAVRRGDDQRRERGRYTAVEPSYGMTPLLSDISKTLNSVAQLQRILLQKMSLLDSSPGQRRNGEDQFFNLIQQQSLDFKSTARSIERSVAKYRLLSQRTSVPLKEIAKYADMKRNSVPIPEHSGSLWLQPALRHRRSRYEGRS
jgi:hypothetical protein